MLLKLLKLKGFRILGTALLFGLLSVGHQQPSFATKNILAMWVWDARIVTQTQSQDNLINFCRRQGINTLYLSAYDLRGPMHKNYQQFNRKAHRAGVEVHALAGDPRWGKKRYHHIPMEWVDRIIEFNAKVPPPERFDGVHTDIEIYLLARTWRKNPAVLLGSFLDLNKKIKDRLVEAQDTSIYGVDLPFWFDDDSSYRIMWNNAVKNPAQHIMDTVDVLTIMAYRNFSEGTDGTVHLVSSELQYGDANGTPVVIGQETQEKLYPKYVTFGGTSCESLIRELKKMRQALSGRKGFGGFAIHHYESYKKLCKG